MHVPLVSVRGCPSGTIGATTVNAPWLCTYPVVGCTNPLALNYNSNIPPALTSSLTAATTGFCMIAGCNDTEAINFNADVRTGLHGTYICIHVDMHMRM